MRASLIFPMTLAALVLASCGDKTDQPSESERGSAAGEVLGGTVSDAMIPLDNLRSSSPIDGVATNDSVPVQAASGTQEGAEAADVVAPQPADGEEAETDGTA